MANRRRPVNRVSATRRSVSRRPRVAGDPTVTRSTRLPGGAVPRPEPPVGARATRGTSHGRPRGGSVVARARLRLPRRTGAAKGTRMWMRPLVTLLVAGLLAGFAALAAARPGVADDNAAFVDNAATEEVRAAAEHALHTVYGYRFEDIGGYEAAVREVVTGPMLDELDTFAETTVSAIEQARTSADAQADPIGVSLLTEDRAEVLVNLVVSATKDGAAQQSVAGPVVLHMHKENDRWLAADIVDQ